MSEGFLFDVFLSHSSRDKTVVLKVAKCLQADGLHVWFDEWVLKPGDSIPARIEEGLERSRVLVLCMSANAFGSDWARLEADTFRFRDPLNKKRRFIPFRLDDSPIKGSLAQFMYIDWRQPGREQEYAKLLEACQPEKARPSPEQQETRDRLLEKTLSLGHTVGALSVAWSPDSRRALSGSADNTVRLWKVESGRCLGVLGGHTAGIWSVAWSSNGLRALSGVRNGLVRLWNLSEAVSTAFQEVTQTARTSTSEGGVQYTNAKVLLVGESGVGKTGLSKRLAQKKWEPSDSTVGAWATQWKLPVSFGEGVDREIWLWDFGGQADQLLIHQLYMDETALVVLVFDGQKEDLFETLGQWDRDLTRASRKEFAKLLVAGRVDSGGLSVSRSDVEKFATERKFQGFLETSVKTNKGCEELKQAILATINWDEIPWRTTEFLFKRLKEEIICLKDQGRVLMRFNELREVLQLRLSGEFKRFADEELHAVLTLLAGPGVVWELAFGSWVLLQPERINAYAQAVIRTLQEDEHQRGCLMEERVLKGDVTYESSMPRLAGDEERFVLLAMHQTLVERGLCLRQPTSQGNLLIFPCYYRRERSEQVQFPAVLVNYRFTGFLDEIYATLVVRLHHTEPFKHDQLWRYAADFKTNTGKQLGVKLTRRAPGVGELEVYFDPAVSMEEKIIFSKYVHEHLLQHGERIHVN